jgi:beta-galactosidase
VKYEQTVEAHYEAFWKKGVAVDVIDMEADLSKYKVLVAPMLYLVREGVGERIEKFVEQGGTFVATYWSGIVNENDLCFLGGFPGPLRKTLGIWSEEIDGLHDRELNGIIPAQGNELGLTTEYDAIELCDLIHLEGAKSLAVYRSDFYAGRPALTVNELGSGKAYYMAARMKAPFYDDFYGKLIADLDLERGLKLDLPAGTTAHVRTDGDSDYVFVQNYTEHEKQVQLDSPSYTDVLSGEAVEASLDLQPYDIRVLRRAANRK